MATTQTYAILTAQQKTFYDRTLLKRLLANLVFLKYGQKKPLKSNEGDTINFRKFNSLAPALTALTEGVTPNGNALDITAITAVVKQYGDFVQLSDKIDMVGIDPVLTETAKLLGEQAGLTLDTVARDILATGTNVQYAGGTSTANVVNKLTSAEVKKAVRTLRKANAKPYEGKYFIGIIDPEQAFDMMEDPLWQDVSKYNGGTAILAGEVGKMAGVRFIETTNVLVKTGDVHCALIIGADAYGIVDVEGSSKPEMIIKPAGSGGTSDPLNQRSTAGWKAMMTVRILNELTMLRLETKVSV